MIEEFIKYHKPMKLPTDEMKELHSQIDEVMNTGMLTNGKYVRELEEKIAMMYNVDYAIATSNATQGLVIALDHIKYISKARSIHTPAFGWYSSLYAIKKNNLVPHFIDITDDEWTMKHDKCKLALPIHTFGNSCLSPADYILYDGAHSLGSKLIDIGDATVLSLAPTKIVTSIEGGIVLTNIEKLATHTKFLRDKTCRMSEIHAIFGLKYLNHIDEIMRYKKEAFDYYQNNLVGQFQYTKVTTNYNTIGMLTNLLIPDSIEVKRYYEPLSSTKGLKNTQFVYKNIVCLPSWYGVDYKEVVRRINEFTSVTKNI